MKQVVVCGAGVVGLCCALHLRERGFEVTILERDSELRDGCSFGNAGMIVPSHFVPLASPGMAWQGFKWMFDRRSPFYIRPRFDPGLVRWGWKFMRASNTARAIVSSRVLLDLLLASRELHDKLSRELPDVGLTRRGMLTLCRTQHALDEEAAQAETATAMGLPAEVVSPQRAAQLDPDMRMDIAGGIYFPLDCHLDPRLLMQELPRLAMSAGVQLRLAAEVTGWRTAGGRIAAVRTMQGDLEADEFVVAGGAWSPAMVRGLGIELPMQAGKGYSLTLQQPRRLPRLCSVLAEARVTVTPMGSSLRVGGTMELAGMDRSIGRERVRAIVEAATKYFPELRAEDFSTVRPWAGLRPCSPDGLPYIGRFARYSNLCAATGHAMLGVSLAPVTGQLVADIVADAAPRLSIEALSPDRYT